MKYSINMTKSPYEETSSTTDLIKDETVPQSDLLMYNKAGLRTQMASFQSKPSAISHIAVSPSLHHHELDNFSHMGLSQCSELH